MRTALERRTPILIAAAAVTLSAMLAWRPSLLVLGGMLALAGILVFARWPVVGLLALVPLSLLVPVGISTGTETQINAAVLLVGLLTSLWAVDLALSHTLRVYQTRLLLPLIAFGVASVLSFIVGLQSWLPFVRTAPVPTQVGGLAIYLLSLCAFLLIANRVPDAGALRLIVWELVCIGAVYMVARATSVPLPVTAPQADGSMFWTWIVALAFSQALLNRKLPPLVRCGLLAVVGLTIAIGLTNKDWNSGWTPPLVAVAVILALGAPRLAVPAFLAGIVGTLLNLPTLLPLFVTNDYKQYDLLTRTAAWDILMDVVRLEPVMGTGFGNYYWYTPFYSILGYNVSFNSHNNYVDLLAQTGVIGLVCFVWLVFKIGRLAWKLRTRVPDGFERAYVYGVIGGLVATLVAAFLGDWVLPFVYNVGMAGFRASVLAWIFLGGLVVLERALDEGESQQQVSKPACPA